VNTGLQVLFVEDDDTIRRCPMSRFDKLNQDDPAESFPEYACKRMRFALVLVVIEGERVASVFDAQYCLMQFDSDGRRDSAFIQELIQLLDETSKWPEPDREDKIINGRSLFAEERWKHEFSWEPSPEMEQRIFQTVLQGE